MRLRHNDKVIFLFVIDLVCMLSAFAIALLLGHQQSLYMPLFGYYFWGIVTLFASVVVVFITLDLYSLHKMPERFMVQIVYVGLGLVLSAVVVTFLFFFFRNAIPRAVFLVFYLYAFIFITSARAIFNRLTLAMIYWKVLVVGSKKESERIADVIDARKFLHSTVVGYLSEAEDPHGDGALPRLGSIERLREVVEREDIDQIILATTRTSHLTNHLLDIMKKRVKIIDFYKFNELVAGKVPIDHLSDTWFVSELSSIDKRYFWYGKRLMDIVMSVTGICLALPILLISALAIKIDSSGPILYSQIRIGRGGRPFRVWKLRTMVPDADKNDVHWTTDNDARITRMGRWIRKTRMDEVPQLYNILRGDMTLIGPRPEAESLVALYAKEIPYYQERHMVTPGITGWAQINYRYGNSIEDTREKLKYDLYYVKNRSLMLDAIIFLRTIRIVLTGKGAL